jgi:hypothetical protein
LQQCLATLLAETALMKVRNVRTCKAERCLPLLQALASFRFYNYKRDWQQEMALYQHADIRTTLPPIHGGAENASGSICSPSGFAYPPSLSWSVAST